MIYRIRMVVKMTNTMLHMIALRFSFPQVSGAQECTEIGFSSLGVFEASPSRVVIFIVATVSYEGTEYLNSFSENVVNSAREKKNVA